MAEKSAVNILVVSQHFYPEGFRINDLVDGFIEHGYGVSVLCGLPNYPKGEWYPGYSGKGPFCDSHNGASVCRSYEVPRKGNTSVRIFLNYLSWPLTAAIKAFSLKADYDIVICYNTSPVMMLFPAIVAAKRKHVPLIGYVLDIWPENLYTVLPIGSRVLRKIAQKVSDWHYSKANRLVSMSGSLKANLLKRDAIQKNRIPIEVLPQHAEDFYAKPLCDRALSEKYKDKFLIVFAGNISPAQDLENAIEAVSLYAASYGRDIHLLVVGDGMSLDSVKSLVEVRNVSDMVSFVGRVEPEEVPKYYGIADALLIPFSSNKSLALTVPAKVASCMASAKPLIGYLEGEGRKAIESAKCGLVSDPGDPGQFAQAMRELLLLPVEQRTIMGKNAFAHYRSNYSREAILDKFDEIIEKTLC